MLRLALLVATTLHITRGQLFEINFPNLPNCGFLLRSSFENSSQQNDTIQSVISSILKSTTDISSLVILHHTAQNVVPAIFPTMKYNCYINIHIELGYRLFSSVPLEFGVARKTNVLFSRGIFFVLVFRNPYHMIGDSDWYYQQPKQQRIFVIQVHKEESPATVNIWHIQGLKTTLYFFCTFCHNFGLRELNSHETILQTPLLDFQHEWKFLKHYWYAHIGVEGTHKRRKFCYNAHHKHFYSRIPYCYTMELVYSLIAHKYNISLETHHQGVPWYPSISQNINPTAVTNVFSTPVLISYRRSGVVYCNSKASTFL